MSKPLEATALKVGLISLGCAKNLIDSEIMVGHLHKAGMAMTPDAADADVVVINTCSFVDAAKDESIEAIFEAHRDREVARRGAQQKIIVAGCMSQRYASELPAEMPEVDAFIGLDQITEIAQIIESVIERDRTLESDQGETEFKPGNFVTSQPRYIPDYDTPRFRLTPGHTAYLKIAEGCNHPCSFCIIPRMRGRHRSRTIESVVQEARQLVTEGVKELNLISQDTTYFGMDRWEERPNPRSPVDSTRGDSLARLLRELNAIEGKFWIRLLYTHPAHWSDELIQTIADCPKVARYVDMPLQHISDHMLTEMRRETNGAYIRDLIHRIRAKIPRIALRTTFIVGFPGETEEDFAELLDFIRETEFERLGIFRYSQEEGTRASKMAEQIDDEAKEERWNQGMALQQEVAARTAARAVGQLLPVLVETPGIARSEADAPDIDGRVFVDEALPAGEFAKVKIVGASAYDLIAERGAEPVSDEDSTSLVYG